MSRIKFICLGALVVSLFVWLASMRTLQVVSVHQGGKHSSDEKEAVDLKRNIAATEGGGGGGAAAAGGSDALARVIEQVARLEAAIAGGAGGGGAVKVASPSPPPPPPVGPKLNTTPPPLAALNCGWGSPRASPYPGRILDIVTFNEEFDIYEARVYELDAIVDLFIVSEANWTHAMTPKKRTFMKFAHERLKPFLHKIVYHDASNVNWAACQAEFKLSLEHRFSCEIALRNSVHVVIPGGIKNDDIILFCDADEITNRNALQVLRFCDFAGGSQLPGFNLRTSHYSLHYYAVRHSFPSCPYFGHRVQHGQLQGIHKNCGGLNPVWGGDHGWHMSYFGSAEFIKMKLATYAETQTNVHPYNDLEYIRDHQRRGLDLLERDVFEFRYMTNKTLTGPWFALANRETRPSHTAFVHHDLETD